MSHVRLAAACLLLLGGCGNSATAPAADTGPTAPPVRTGACGAAAPATFELTLTGAWSAGTHPGDFPSGAHFSTLVGGAHKTRDIVWVRDGAALATNGIEAMAELGGTGTLLAEIDGYIASGDAGVKIVAGGGISAAGTTSVTFTTTMEHPLLSVVTMVAPSPDWFLGVANFDLCRGGTWIDDVTVDLDLVYDAATDNGPSFTSANADQTPHLPIRLVADEGNHFLGPQAPLATLRIRRVP